MAIRHFFPYLCLPILFVSFIAAPLCTIFLYSGSVVLIDPEDFESEQCLVYDVSYEVVKRLFHFINLVIFICWFRLCYT